MLGINITPFAKNIINKDEKSTHVIFCGKTEGIITLKEALSCNKLGLIINSKEKKKKYKVIFYRLIVAPEGQEAIAINNTSDVLNSDQQKAMSSLKNEDTFIIDSLKIVDKKGNIIYLKALKFKIKS